MAFIIEGNLNEAHEQALSLWDKMTKPQDRRLFVTMENTLSQTLRTYGSDTLSSKCHIIQEGGYSVDEVLPPHKTGLCMWLGSIQITGVVSIYLETHPVGGANFDQDVREFA